MYILYTHIYYIHTQTGKEEPPTTGFIFIWKHSTLACESADKQTLLVITQLK